MTEHQDFTALPFPLHLSPIELGVAAINQTKPFLALRLNVRKLGIGLSKDDATPRRAMSLANMLRVSHQETVSLAGSACSMKERLEYGTLHEVIL